MNKTFYKIKDRLEEWLRYSQPTRLQKELLGMHTDVMDYDVTAIRLASESSARYMIDNMRAVPNFDNDYDYRDWIVRTQLDPRLELIAENGVATARTINHIARLCPNKTVHGFDSFEGLPEDWTSRMPKGFFKRNALPKVRSNVELHVGWFDVTLPKFKETIGNKTIQLLHIDSDLYSSAVTILETLADNIVPGTVIMFDEYINYPGWELDEFKAWQEFKVKYNVEYDYIARVSKHQKVAVKVTKIAGKEL